MRPQLWSSANHSIARVEVQNSIKQSKVTSVQVSQCGNFGVLGFASGAISKFNMQSGKERTVFSLDTKSTFGETLHTAEITGLGTDQVNKHLVSTSMDKTVKLWDFYRGVLIKTYQTDYPITRMAYNRMNDLVAIASSDLSITILNPKTGLKRVRHFPNAAQNKINDVCFSQPDSRWLLSCSMDCCIRVWDIVTGALVDWVKFRNAPLSIDFSPSGEFLATSHLNSKAVFLWSNRAFFQHIVIQKVPEKPKQIDLPSMLTTEVQKVSHKDFYKGEEAEEVETTQPADKQDQSYIMQKLAALKPQMQTVEQEKEDYLTLSDQPYSKWQAIFNLEQIKERNKPKLQKESLPKVPFFLFDLDKATNLEGEGAARDFLTETFFTNFDQKRKD